MPKTGLFKKAEQAFLKKVTFSEKRLPQITEKKGLGVSNRYGVQSYEPDSQQVLFDVRRHQNRRRSYLCRAMAQQQPHTKPDDRSGRIGAIQPGLGLRQHRQMPGTRADERRPHIRKGLSWILMHLFS